MADDRNDGRSRYGREGGMHSDGRDDWDRGRREQTGWGGSGGRGPGEDRGFFERAGDEMRSWFGDEEAERRRERAVRPGGRDDDWRGGYRNNQPGPERSRYGDSGGSWGSSGERQTWGGSGGRSGSGDRADGQRGGSHWDDHYRQWREQQIRQLDQEYEEYRRERQHHFESDFATWRQNRQGSGSQSPDQGAAGSFGSDAAGATTTGGGTASAASASTGSSDTDAVGQPIEGSESRSGSGG